MASALLIDGEVIKKPTAFGIERYNLTKSGRVASGRMTMDIIAQKIKFTFSYDVLSGPDLDQILRLIYNPARPFFEVTHEENGRIEKHMCYSGAPKYTKFRTDGQWYWKNVTFDLIEQ